MSALKHGIIAGLVMMSIAGCASQGEKQVTQASQQAQAKPLVNDFPTQALVEYVFQCMRDHGGQNYDNLYHCSCKMDELAKQMDYQEYSEAIVFKNLKSMPGERGGLFRDPPQSKTLRNKLKQVEEAAEAHCFLK